MEIIDELFELQKRQTEVLNQGRDNLFSANHRSAMIRLHGGTQAQWITIEDLERN